MKVVENGSWFCFFKYSFLEKLNICKPMGTPKIHIFFNLQVYDIQKPIKTTAFKSIHSLMTPKSNTVNHTLSKDT